MRFCKHIVSVYRHHSLLIHPPLPVKAGMWLDQIQIEAIICNMQQWHVFTSFWHQAGNICKPIAKAVDSVR